MDQRLLSYIFSSLSRDVFIGVGRHRTSAQVWRALGNSFASQTQARSVNTRISLTATKKGEMSVTDYFNKMKFYGDEMVAAREVLDDEELVSYILGHGPWTRV